MPILNKVVRKITKLIGFRWNLEDIEKKLEKFTVQPTEFKKKLLSQLF